MPEPFGHLGWQQVRARPKASIPAAGRRRLLALEPTLVSRLTYLVVGLYALTFAVLSILQHDSFNTHAFDLGNMDQAVWNTAHGRWFRFTNWEGGTSRLAAHVEPILLPISQLYRIYCNPKTLLVLQSIVISLGALPAFWLARDRLRNYFAAATFASAYLLAPALEVANLTDFHAVSLASSLLLFAFYFISRKRYLLFFLVAILAMATKEQVPISVMLMGLYIFFIQRERIPGAVTIVVSVIWLIAAFAIVIPYFNPKGASPYLSRYDHLGASAREIIATFIFNPRQVLLRLLEPVKVDYVLGLFEPVLFLSLFSPLVALAFPDLGINLLSSFPDMYTGRAHYGAIIAPFLVVSAIYGTRFLVSQVQRLSPRLGHGLLYLLSTAVLFSSLKGYYQEVFLPLTDHLPQITDHNKLAQKFIELTPRNAGVSASSTLNPHVSQRERLYLFPDVRDAEYVFLDVSATPHPIDVPSLRWRVEQLLGSGKWGIIAAEDGYLLLKRGATERALPDRFYSFARSQKPTISQPTEVVFGDSLRFLGYNAHPNGKLHGGDPYASVTLFWEALSQPQSDYLIVLYVVEKSGRIVSTQAYHPATTWYPTSRWGVGETIQIEVARVPLWDATNAEVWLGVTGEQDLKKASARLLPTPGKGSRIKIDKEQRLVKLMELERE